MLNIVISLFQEEEVITTKGQDPESLVLVKKRKNFVQVKNTRDINRYFPYLVKEDQCMQTIGARVVNELYMKHLFSLALTLHGGTESLTYSYGAPNHVVKSPKIPMNYEQIDGKLISMKTDQTDAIVEKYTSGSIEAGGKSTLPPDDNGIKGT